MHWVSSCVSQWPPKWAVGTPGSHLILWSTGRKVLHLLILYCLFCRYIFNAYNTLELEYMCIIYVEMHILWVYAKFFTDGASDKRKILGNH